MLDSIRAASAGVGVKQIGSVTTEARRLDQHADNTVLTYTPDNSVRNTQQHRFT